MVHYLNTPLEGNPLEDLNAGDTVYLSGVVYTARDAAHKRLCELIAANGELPFELKGSAIYYVGPTPEKPGQVIGSAGPTTSGRMDAYSPILLDLGQPVMIGKGKRSREVVDAIVRNKAVYLAAIGGAGALMSSCITSCEIIAWPDLGCEAVRKLTVENLPLTVIIDSRGKNLYEEGPRAYLDSLH